MQDKIDTIHYFFLDTVKENRNLTGSQMAEIDSGIFFIGSEALELGLVDELGTHQAVHDWLNATVGNDYSIKRYEDEPGLLEALSNIASPIRPASLRIES